MTQKDYSLRQQGRLKKRREKGVIIMRLELTRLTPEIEKAIEEYETKFNRGYPVEKHRHKIRNAFYEAEESIIPDIERRIKENDPY